VKTEIILFKSILKINRFLNASKINIFFKYFFLKMNIYIIIQLLISSLIFLKKFTT